MRGALWALVALALSACGGGGSVSEPDSGGVPLPGAYVAPMCAVAWGDSLTMGHGTDMPNEPYPARLATMQARDVRNFGIAGQTSTEILDRIRAPEAEGQRGCISLLWMGRNNFWTQEVLGDVVAATMHQTSGRYLVLSVLNADNENRSTWQWARVGELNKALQELYTTKFVDVRQALINAADPNSPLDAADVAAGLIPRSLRVDTVHLNPRGYNVVANTVADAIRRVGW
jgi:lysophospholipase L1-like esterase